MSSPDAPLEFIAKLLADARLPHALIGGHAVNAFLPPRFTADIDITVQADPEALKHLRLALEQAGYRVTTEDGVQLSSGPDFIRFNRGQADPPIELQAAKTKFQEQIIGRAVKRKSGMAVATVEDLIVLKLIASRPKDKADIAGLVKVQGVDWDYVEQSAAAWDILDRLARARANE